MASCIVLASVQVQTICQRKRGATVEERGWIESDWRKKKNSQILVCILFSAQFVFSWQTEEQEGDKFEGYCARAMVTAVLSSTSVVVAGDNTDTSEECTAAGYPQ